MGTTDELAATVRMVEARGRRCVTGAAGVREASAVQSAVDTGVAQFGRLDVVVPTTACWKSTTSKIAKALANELAPWRIRVNTVHPTSVANDRSGYEADSLMLARGTMPRNPQVLEDAQMTVAATNRLPDYRRPSRTRRPCRSSSRSTCHTSCCSSPLTSRAT